MRVRYGKPIIVKSLLGTFNLTGQGTTTGGFMVSSNEGHFKYQASVTNLRKFGIFNGHKYFLCAKSEFALDSFVFMSSSSWYQELYKSTTPTYADNYSYVNIENVNADNSNIAVLVWCKNHASWEVYDGIVIDLTEAFGSGNEPTAQQFYNKYNKYFPLIATGEEITIDDKAGQIAGDILYGYNQICYNNNFDSTDGWFMQNGTLSVADNTCSFSPTNLTSHYVRLTQQMTYRVKPVQGHIYYMTCKMKSSINLPINCFQYAVGPTSINCNSSQIVADTWYEFPKIITVSSSVPSDTYLTINVYQGDLSLTEAYTIDVMKANLIDLTDWYGAGNEPSTVQAFKDKFSKELYGYSPKVLKLTRNQIEAEPMYGYNQMVRPLSSTSDSGFTWTYVDNLLTFTSTNPTKTYFNPFYPQYVTSGHKYFISANIISNSNNTSFQFGTLNSNIRLSNMTTGLYENIIECNYEINSSIGLATFTVGANVGTVSGYYMLVDLTDWYGAGDEPSTVAEFKQTFPNKYYQYSKKSLLNKYMINYNQDISNNIMLGKVAGGSSGTYYGYNQKVLYNSGWGQTNCTVDTTAHTNEITMVSNGQGNMTYTNVLYKAENVRASANTSHKYLIRYYLTPSVSGLSCNAYYYSTTDTMPANETTIYEKILKSPSDNLNALDCHNIQIKGTLADGDTVKVKIAISDLTEWFGTGKEPTTIEEFKTKFAKEYYGICPTAIKLTRYQIEAEPTYGYNQLIQNGDFSDGTNKWSTDRISISASNNILTATWNSDVNGRLRQGSVETIQAHKYLGLCEVCSSISGTLKIEVSRGWTSGSTSILANTWTNVSQFINPAPTATDSNKYFQIFMGGTTSSNLPYSLQLKNIVLIDLTDWYGAGSEPTTIEEFKATFPNKYYPYSKKRLLNKYMINKLIN